MDATRTKRFQRSEDGQTWTVIEPKECRRKLSGHYRDVDAVINAMVDGQPVRTPYAFYRLAYADQPPPLTPRRERSERNG